MKRKNILLTLAFACCPGFGQMYQGYMKRGVSLTFWFAAVIAAGVLLNAGVVVALAVVVWAYAFFDTFNIRNLSEQQRAYFYDDYIPNAQWLADHKLDRLAKPGATARWGGIACIVIGILVLYNNVLYRVLNPLFDILPGLYGVVSALPTLAMALGIIVLGVWMIRRSKGIEDDDVVPFGGKPANDPRPQDYMPKSNTPPAPWAQADAPAAPEVPLADGQLEAEPVVEVVEEAIVLTTEPAIDVAGATPAEEPEAAAAEAAPAKKNTRTKAAKKPRAKKSEDNDA